MEKLKKIKLRYNELGLVCKKRVDGVIYSIYISDKFIFKDFDSGFNPDEWDFDTGIINSSLQNALNQFGYNFDIKSEHILGSDYSDNFGTYYYKHWISDPSITIIDQLSPYYSTILVHSEENKGIDEDLTPHDLIEDDNFQGFISECLDNFIGSGYFRML
jgi:hypothetical protein